MTLPNLLTPRPRFTADFHLGHAGILRHVPQRRLWWHTVQGMAVALQLLWEASDAGPVIHLGDFTLGGKAEMNEQLRRFACEERPGFFMPGNHDIKALRKTGLVVRGDGTWAEKDQVLEHAHGMVEPYDLTLDGISLHMTHRPLNDWPGRDEWAGVIHLHGHSHGKAPNLAGRIDVGVDLYGRILTWSDVQDIILVNRRERTTTRTS